MMAKIDKFLVAELQERGFNLDYKTLTEIYKDSRNRTDCLARKTRRDNENAMMERLEKRLIEMRKE